MELGLGALGLSPLVFWSLTPRELRAALRGRFASASEGDAPTHRDLCNLMQRYPDERMSHGND